MDPRLPDVSRARIFKEGLPNLTVMFLSGVCSWVLLAAIELPQHGTMVHQIRLPRDRPIEAVRLDRGSSHF
jgi:hypothetical protein